MPEEPARYQLGPRSRRGLVAGWRGGQLATVASGLVAGVLLLRAFGGGSGAVLALLAAGVSLAVATWPLSGRTAEQWAPVVVAHAARRATGLRRGRGALAALELDSLAGDGEEPIGVVVDSSLGTWTGVLRISGAGFALGDDEERARRIAGWSGVLAAVAREAGAVHRLQWVARSLPGRLAEGALLEPTDGRSAAELSYRSLLHRAAPVLWRHEVLLALTVRSPGPAPGRRADRRTSGQAPAGRHRAGGDGGLLEELAALQRRCGAAGLEVDGALSPAALAAVVRRAYTVRGAPEAVADSWPWPLGVEASWSSLRTDATWQATYWVAEWPRGEVGTSFLLPLLLDGALRRTVAVTMAPVPGLRAVRRVEHERTSSAADAELRQRHGFAVTARARREHEVTVRRESELAEGHGAFRFTGYLAVTAEDEDALEADCARMERSAAQSQLELHRLYGAQEEAFACTLPTGRGCQ